MATIKELAQKAGVSRGTVDRVLHNRGRVNPIVRNKILELAEQMHYKPNKAGQALAFSGKFKRIGVVLPSLSNPFFVKIVEGMNAAAQKNDLTLVFQHYSSYDESVCLNAIDSILKRNVDSLLVTLPDTDLINKKLEESGKIFAAVNSGLSSLKCIFYSGANYTQKGRINAGLLALTADFAPRVLFLRGSSEMKGHRQILEGFEETLKDRNINYTISGDKDTADDDKLSYQIVKEALAYDENINTIFIATAGVKGVLDAVEDKKLFIFSSDETEDVKQGLKKDKLKWTVSQDAFLQGYNAVKKISDYIISGQKPCDFIARNIVKIKENIGEEICM